MSATVDIPALEAAFLRIFAWVQGGEPNATSDDHPYRWKRGGWEATNMSTSPAGAYQAIRGADILAYYRPHRGGFGYGERVDLRTKTTPATLIAAAATIDRTSEAVIVLTDLQMARGSWWSDICTQGDPLRRPNLASEAFTAGYRAGIERAAALAAAATPSSVSATGEAHMRSYRDSIVHQIKKELP